MAQTGTRHDTDTTGTAADTAGESNIATEIVQGKI